MRRIDLNRAQAARASTLRDINQRSVITYVRARAKATIHASGGNVLFYVPPKSAVAYKLSRVE